MSSLYRKMWFVIILFSSYLITAQVDVTKNKNSNHEENAIIELRQNVEEIVNLLDKNDFFFKREKGKYIVKKKGLDYLKSLNIPYNVIGTNLTISNNSLKKSTNENYKIHDTQDSDISGGNDDNIPIPDYVNNTPGYADSRFSITSAPSTAIISKVEYRVRVTHTYPSDLDIALNHDNTNDWIWLQYGGNTDGGYDDDTENNDDIYLNWRISNSFNGLSVNGQWMLVAWDNSAGDDGMIDYVQADVYYETPYIQITNPNSSSIWEKGKTYQIQWDFNNYSLDENVRIVLLKNGYVQTPDIIVSTPNDGMYNWSVPSSGLVADNDYRIGISCNSAYDYSDEFTISNSHSTKGDLQVTVFNVNNTTNPLPGSNAVVQLYNALGTLVGSEPTNNDGVAYFDNIEQGTGYYYKVYHNPSNPSTIFMQEYWGRRDGITIVADELMYDSLKRNMPYNHEIKIYNNSTNQVISNGDSIAAGTELRIVSTIINPNFNGSENQTVKSRVVIDLDKSESFAYDKTSNAESIIKNSSNDFTFYYTPTDEGTYYYVTGTSSNISGIYKNTDGWAWNDNFKITVTEVGNYIIKPPFVNASYVHRENEIAGIWGRRVGSASDCSLDIGKIEHRSLIGANLFGGTNWYVKDEIQIPFSVTETGSYKITVKSKINGVILAGRVGEIGHCSHYLACTAGIYGVGGKTIELHNTLNEEWPSSLEYFTEGATKAIINAFFSTGWITFALDVTDVIKVMNDIKEYLDDLRFFNNEQISNEGIVVYGELEKDKIYKYSYQLVSNNIAGTSAGLVTSIIDVNTVIEEILIENTNPIILQKPKGPQLYFPLNNETNVRISPTLGWETVIDAFSYNLQVSKNYEFTSLIVNETEIISPFKENLNLDDNQQYYWRVFAVNSAGMTSSDIWNFQTKEPVVNNPPDMPQLYSPANGFTLKKSEKLTFSWSCSDSDLDTLNYDLFYSDDGASYEKDSKGSSTSFESDAPSEGDNGTYYWYIEASDGQYTVSSDTFKFYIDIPSSIKELFSKKNIPIKYFLSNNFPNPFNPSTTISFGLPEQSTVSLNVFDITGKVVEELLQKEYLPAGSYNYSFNAKDLSSGIYFYKLQTEKFVDVKKMILLR